MSAWGLLLAGTGSLPCKQGRGWTFAMISARLSRRYPGIMR
jgi:hypothetical protein